MATDAEVLKDELWQVWQVIDVFETFKMIAFDIDCQQVQTGEFLSEMTSSVRLETEVDATAFRRRVELGGIRT